MQPAMPIDRHRACTGDPDNGVTRAQLDAYRVRRRQRLHLLRQRPDETTPRLGAELIQFACRWTPYGRAPDDEVFEKFGMTPERFAGQLLEALKTEECAPDVAATLRATYPPS
ncbi:hypothetical protein [Rhodococcus sp. JS3073]|uniref:hypothetical protein n=1 Tax=Rhodococcus sp. JS3073 TaxID=3002901 RepID=UPI0022866FF1|nr:hypothetical protein [Rhodococcus sp. JS3073]WAM19905.1 hypothetical protein OYT95_40415 [Rhodococcus sp. JS3073]